MPAPARGERRYQSWIAVALLWLIMIAWFVWRTHAEPGMAYSDLKAKLAAGEVEEVTLGAKLLRGTFRGPDADGRPRTFEVVRVEDPALLGLLEQHGVRVRGEQESSLWPQIVGSILPLVLLFGVLAWNIRAQRPPGGFLAIGRSKARVYMEKDVSVRFADVAGVDEAKEELQEVIEFLRTPERFRRLGGKIPKGILLVGPPGTGKTLLARAVAGETAVPFFSISGSEFVEMFVGVGAARVRDLFTQAKSMAPCIIFIDELDALGKVRGAGPMSHDEREQTLNQLLVELDGFDARSGVILMAATNRPEILDPALLRAGRFDRHVLVDRPDKSGRLAILKVHARPVALGPDADLEVLAAMTPGMVGADLANLVNEAALLAVRRGKDAVGLAELQEAVERVTTGLEKRNRVLSPKERERVAVHEIGHALVALNTPGLDAVQKISIIPRGIAALGYTLQRPTEDRFLMTQSELEARIAMLLGGRVAEELVYREVSTGAQDDLLKATDIAHSMVKVYGMAKALGHLSFDRGRRSMLLEPSMLPERADYSDDLARQIDREVRRIVDGQYGHAKRVLGERLELLREAAAVLLAKETLSGEELAALAAVPRRDTRPPHAA